MSSGMTSQTSHTASMGKAQCGVKQVEQTTDRAEATVPSTATTLGEIEDGFGHGVSEEYCVAAPPAAQLACSFERVNAGRE